MFLFLALSKDIFQKTSKSAFLKVIVSTDGLTKFMLKQLYSVIRNQRVVKLQVIYSRLL